MPPPGEDGESDKPGEDDSPDDSSPQTVGAGSEEPFVMAESDDGDQVTGEGNSDDSAEPGDDGQPDVEDGGPIDAGEGIESDGPDIPGEPEETKQKADGPLEWFLRSDDFGAAFFREFLGSVFVVLIVGMLLFAISGVWPPMVAVKSGSMEPEMERGDLVFVMDENRFPPDASVEGTGIATYDSASETGYRRFGDYGDVVIYRRNGNGGETPIIHRARFWVDEGENWYEKANESFIQEEDCEAISNCPAPHAGFITKGDNNEGYDQVKGISGVVKPEWIKGTAELRIPWLGHIRLELSGVVVSPSAAGAPSVAQNGTAG